MNIWLRRSSRTRRSPRRERIDHGRPNSAQWADDVLSREPGVSRSEAYRKGLVYAHAKYLYANALAYSGRASMADQDAADFDAAAQRGDEILRQDNTTALPIEVQP